ncbi:hypothetical protein AMTRI_Chr03g56110 [Amborella trichopoda]
MHYYHSHHSTVIILGVKINFITNLSILIVPLCRVTLVCLLHRFTSLYLKVWCTEDPKNELLFFFPSHD